MRAYLTFIWCWVGLGLTTGTLIGIFFHKNEFLGGYDSWERCMLRLGHIAFFGTAFLNFAYLATCTIQSLPLDPITTSLCIAGTAAMPAVCFLSAWIKSFRHHFFIPVTSLPGGVLLILWKGIAP